MSILAWIVIGIIAGLLAKSVVPGEGPGGLAGDLIIGVIGAFIGGWVFNEFGNQGVSGLNLYSILVATVGAILLLALMRLVRRRST